MHEMCTPQAFTLCVHQRVF